MLKIYAASIMTGCFATILTQAEAVGWLTAAGSWGFVCWYTIIGLPAERAERVKTREDFFKEMERQSEAFERSLERLLHRLPQNNHNDRAVTYTDVK
jgi:hypothetical protein